MQLSVLCALLAAAFALGFFVNTILDKLLRLCLVLAVGFVLVAAVIHLQLYLKALGVDVFGNVQRFFSEHLSHFAWNWSEFTWSKEL